MIDQVVKDHKLLLQITREIEQKVGSEAAAWDVDTESTNKEMELVQMKQKNKEEIDPLSRADQKRVFLTKRSQRQINSDYRSHKDS